MGQWFWTEKRLILCIYNILLFSLTLIQDTRSWLPLCQYVYLWGTIKVEGQTPIKRLLTQSGFCSATQRWSGTFYRLLLFRSLYRYLLSTHYALDNEKIAMNKANTGPALMKLIVYWRNGQYLGNQTRVGQWIPRGEDFSELLLMVRPKEWEEARGKWRECPSQREQFCERPGPGGGQRSRQPTKLGSQSRHDKGSGFHSNIMGSHQRV